jgi:hypothetical protein
VATEVSTVAYNICGFLIWNLLKRTCERWGLKDGEGKLRIETSEGE